jgi:hypothetical protein
LKWFEIGDRHVKSESTFPRRVGLKRWLGVVVSALILAACRANPAPTPTLDTVIGTITPSQDVNSLPTRTAFPTADAASPTPLPPIVGAVDSAAGAPTPVPFDVLPTVIPVTLPYIAPPVLPTATVFVYVLPAPTLAPSLTQPPLPTNPPPVAPVNPVQPTASAIVLEGDVQRAEDGMFVVNDVTVLQTGDFFTHVYGDDVVYVEGYWVQHEGQWVVQPTYVEITDTAGGNGNGGGNNNNGNNGRGNGNGNGNGRGNGRGNGNDDDD